MKRTLPMWSQGWGFSLDLVRKVVRSSPELQSLGETVGPAKAYTADEAEAIRSAVEARVARGRKQRGVVEEVAS